MSNDPCLDCGKPTLGVMTTYEVRINLNSITYEIEAENEEQAFQFARECAIDETSYDLLKWADYEATALPTKESE